MAQTIIDSGNDYLAALKGNQSSLLKIVETHFQLQQTVHQINKGSHLQFNQIPST